MFSVRVEMLQGHFFPQYFVLPEATEAVAKQRGDRWTLFCWRFGLFLIHWNPHKLLGFKGVPSARISLPAVETPPLLTLGVLSWLTPPAKHRTGAVLLNTAACSWAAGLGCPGTGHRAGREMSSWCDPCYGRRWAGLIHSSSGAGGTLPALLGVTGSGGLCATSGLCRAMEPSEEEGTGDMSLGCNGASLASGQGTSHCPDIMGEHVVLVLLTGPWEPSKREQAAAITAGSGAGAAGAPAAAGSALPFPPQGDKACPPNPAPTSGRGQPERHWRTAHHGGGRGCFGDCWVPHRACIPAGAVPPPEKSTRSLCLRFCHHHLRA